MKIMTSKRKVKGPRTLNRVLKVSRRLRGRMKTAIRKKTAIPMNILLELILATTQKKTMKMMKATAKI